jgi:hypothetical protein
VISHDLFKLGTNGAARPFFLITGEPDMAELKPRHDDQMAGGAPSKKPQPSPETKPHGDKLQGAMDSLTNDSKKQKD